MIACSQLSCVRKWGRKRGKGGGGERGEGREGKVGEGERWGREVEEEGCGKVRVMEKERWVGLAEERQ